MSNSLVMGPEKLTNYISRAGAEFIFERDVERASKILECMVEVYTANSREEKDMLECADSVDNILKKRKEALTFAKYYVEAFTHSFADELKSAFETKLREWGLDAEKCIAPLVDERAAYVLRNNIQPSKSKYLKTD